MHFSPLISSLATDFFFLLFAFLFGSRTACEMESTDVEEMNAFELNRTRSRNRLGERKLSHSFSSLSKRWIELNLAVNSVATTFNFWTARPHRRARRKKKVRSAESEDRLSAREEPSKQTRKKNERKKCLCNFNLTFLFFPPLSCERWDGTLTWRRKIVSWSRYIFLVSIAILSVKRESETETNELRFEGRHNRKGTNNPSNIISIQTCTIRPTEKSSSCLYWIYF